MNCPVCQSSGMTTLFKRERLPVLQNYLCPSEETAIGMPRRDLTFALCRHCGFGFNRTFEQERVPYGDAYDNNQLCSPIFQQHVDRLIDRLVQHDGIRHKTVIEVGCGKGTFLKKLCERGENQGIGFDPSYKGPETSDQERVRFYKKIYGPGCESIEVDAVISRHVIEHVADPVGLLQVIRGALSGSPRAKIYFETPCLEWILRHQVFWDFFYEHCSYFSKASLQTAFEAAGFDVLQMEHIFQGQYLWCEAKVEPNAGEGPTADSRSIIDLAGVYQRHQQEQVEGWKAFIDNLRAKGKVAVWGAGAKGVTFVNVVDPHRERIDCLVDLNPDKQNKYVPGTGHPILPYKTLKQRGAKYALVMNPNYLKENQTLIQEADMDVELLSETNDVPATKR